MDIVNPFKSQFLDSWCLNHKTTSNTATFHGSNFIVSLIGILRLVQYTPLKKYESRLGLLFPTEWKHVQHVPNHQPEIARHVTMVKPRIFHSWFRKKPEPSLWRLSSSACHNNCRACCHSPDLRSEHPMGKWTRSQWLCSVFLGGQEGLKMSQRKSQK